MCNHNSHYCNCSKYGSAADSYNIEKGMQNLRLLTMLAKYLSLLSNCVPSFCRILMLDVRGPNANYKEVRIIDTINIVGIHSILLWNIHLIFCSQWFDQCINESGQSIGANSRHSTMCTNFLFLRNSYSLWWVEPYFALHSQHQSYLHFIELLRSQPSSSALFACSSVNFLRYFYKTIYKLIIY